MYKNELVQLTHTILSTLLNSSSSSCSRVIDPSLERLLFPYIYNNMRSNLTVISYYLTAHNDANNNIHNINNKQLTAFVRANMSSDAACSHAVKALATYSLNPIIGNNAVVDKVMYRRLKASRLQALVTITLDNNNPSTMFDFIYESNSISTNHTDCWRLRFFTFSELDDTEYYWRPWCSSISEAELDYEQDKTMSFRSNLELLRVDDFDFLASSQSSRSSSISEWSLNTTQNLHIHEEDAFASTASGEHKNDLKQPTADHVLIRNHPTDSLWNNNNDVAIGDNYDDEDSYWDRYDDQY